MVIYVLESLESVYMYCKFRIRCRAIQGEAYTVKRVDEVVPHRHLVMQDQTTQVSNKFFDIHVENSIINIDIFHK